MIDQFTIQRVKDAANIVDVMRDLGFDLVKRGTNYECLCPFHEDRTTGSFKVSEAKNIYKCFSCEAEGRPVDFLMNYAHMSFVDAIRWLGQKYNIEVEGAEKFTNVTPCKPHTPPPPLPMLTLPRTIVKPYMDMAAESTLVQWLMSLPWDASQRKRIRQVLWSYVVGGTPDHRTVFWQEDAEGKARTAKLMDYLTNGHRDKSRHPSWIHNFKGVCDASGHEVKKTLFGMHLVTRYPTATLNIVESEKTALIMSIAYGCPERRLWLASGGKANLNPEVLMPLIEQGRTLVLYPDKDAVTEWQGIAESYESNHIRTATDYLKYWREEDGMTADVGDLMLRWLREGGQRQAKKTTTTAPSHSHALTGAMARSTSLRMLVETFDLKEI